MKYFIFRNSTIEPFFDNMDVSFSGYEDISFFDKDANTFIWFYLLPFKPDLNILAEEVNSWLNSFLMVYSEIPSDKNVYVFTLSPLFLNIIQTGDFSLRKVISDYNTNIYDLAERNKNVKIFDFSDFTNRYPLDQVVNWKYYFISKMLLNPQLAKDFNKWFQQQTDAIQLKRKKCVILDLDNTLWGGVLGEDGLDGIKIGGDYPGNAFLEFQKSLLELSRSGIILTICSKNNEKDVLEAWERNPYLILRKEHFSAYRINWNNKAENIRELSVELNIGLDSFVYIDDNPSERELIKQFLPMVEVPDYPIHPYNLPVFFKENVEKYFKIYALTEEDKNKSQQYKANTERAVFRNNFFDFSDYLRSLELVIQLQKANSLNLIRIAQMTQKTNQFNLTTKRYTDSEIVNFVNNGDLVYCISVRDKFGDNGITGLIITEINIEDKSAKIDSLLLSCRILGKGIEDAFIFFILNKLRTVGIKTVQATYLPSVKNTQVENFYERIGFTVVNIDDPVKNAKNYELNLSEDEFEIKSYYKIEEAKQ